MVYFSIVCFLILLAIIKKQSKFLYLLLYLALLFISTHFSDGFDLRNYEASYNQLFFANDVDESERSLLWDLFLFYANLQGISFSQFRVLCFLLWSIPIFTFVYKYSYFPSWALAITYIFPIVTFSSQMRNGIAVSFLYWGFFLFFLNKTNLGKWLYVLLVVIAGLFHYVAFFYLLGFIAFCDKINTKSLVRVVSVFVISSIFFIESGSFRLITTAILGDYYNEHYLSELESFFYWKNILLSVAVIVNIWFSYVAMKKYKMRINDNSILLSNLPIYIFRFNIIMLLALPLMGISNHFYRIFQNVYILTAVSIANVSSQYMLSKSNVGWWMRCSYLIFYFIFVIGIFSIIDGGFFIYWNSIVF